MFFYISQVLFFGLGLSTSCIQDFCSCNDQTIFCLDIITPSFVYRPTVTHLYMEQVQVLDMQNIFSSLPSLHYLTLLDMLYFDCKWLKDMLEQITLMGNTCQSEVDWNTSTKGE